MKLKSIKPNTAIPITNKKELVSILATLIENDYHFTNTIIDNIILSPNIKYIILDYNGKQKTISWSNFLKSDFNVIPFLDLIEPIESELTAKEFFTVIHQICSEIYDCEKCPLYNISSNGECPRDNTYNFEYLVQNADDIIEYCTEWKKQHDTEQRIKNHESIFRDISDEQLQAFVIVLALNVTNDTNEYWDLRRAILALPRAEQVEICEKYYLKKRSCQIWSITHD